MNRKDKDAERLRRMGLCPHGYWLDHIELCAECLAAAVANLKSFD